MCGSAETFGPTGKHRGPHLQIPFSEKCRRDPYPLIAGDRFVGASAFHYWSRAWTRPSFTTRVGWKGWEG